MNNKALGAAFERTVKKHYEELGFFVLKSGGSFSEVDLAVFSTGHLKETFFIQCKRNGYLPSSEKSAILKLSEKTNIPVFLARPGETYKKVIIERIT